MTRLLLAFLETMDGGDGEPETGFGELWDRVWFADFGFGCQVEVDLSLPD